MLSGRPRYHLFVRDITFWRWIYGLALVLTVLVFWFFVEPSDGEPLLGSVALFVLYFLCNLLMLTLLVEFALWAYDAVLDFASFMAELLGLR